MAFALDLRTDRFRYILIPTFCIFVTIAHTEALSGIVKRDLHFQRALRSWRQWSASLAAEHSGEGPFPIQRAVSYLLVCELFVFSKDPAVKKKRERERESGAQGGPDQC